MGEICEQKPEANENQARQIGARTAPEISARLADFVFISSLSRLGMKLDLESVWLSGVSVAADFVGEVLPIWIDNGNCVRKVPSQN